MNMRAVLISGASTGIGHATALQLARDGFTVFAGVRRESDGAELAAKHERLRPVQLDVTDADSIAHAFSVVADSEIPLQAVVNNAGIAVGGPLEYLPLDDLREQFEVNVIGMVAVTQAALPFLRQTRGRVITVGSIASRFGAPFLAPYCASKAAVAMVVDSLRVELAPAGISVVLFEFAAVKTPIWQKGRNLKDDLLARLPHKALEHYAPFIDAVGRQIDHEERVGLEPGVVAKAIASAVTTTSPRSRYVLGSQAHVQAAVAVLPHRLRDNVLRKVLRIP
jgi:NAD(P)-dependent dehydrogenase (short-subunit alcohol dehydrogenase family)